MASLESRIERLEGERDKTGPRPISDTERAVRLASLISKGGPDADRALALVAVVDTTMDEHAHP